MKDKKLFVRDLCARLPYGVKLNVNGYDGCWELTDIGTDSVTVVSEDGEYLDFALSWDGYRPYLRPMLSMTAEEEKELRSLLWFGYPSDDYDNYSHRGIEIKNCLYDNEDKSEYDFEDFELLEEFLFKNHFDFRGLIEKGLALEAPKDMYAIK